MTPRSAARSLLFFTAAALLGSTAGVLPAGAQQAGAQAVPGMKHLSDVWCAPDGSCLGVGLTPGDVGAVVTLRAAGGSGPVRPVPGTESLSSIACPPAGSCVAVGGGGRRGAVVEVGRDGVPGPARTVSGAHMLFDVACATATTCVATGSLTADIPSYPHLATIPLFVVIESGQPGPVRGFPRGTGPVFGIDCPSASTCLIVSRSGFFVLRQVDGGWGMTLRRVTQDPRTGYPTEEISCSSATTCYATAVGFISSGGGLYGVPAIMAVSADGVAGPVQPLSNESGLAYNISCVSGRACTVVGQANGPPAALAIDVVRGSPVATTMWPNVNYFTGVSCVAARTCGMVGNLGNNPFFVWHGPVPA